MPKGPAVTDEQPKHHQALRDLVNRSGFPFQLAVEHHIRETQSRHQWHVVHSEYPAGDGFLDLLLRRDSILGAVECKRTESDWIFVLRQRAQANIENVSRCRLEWYNGRAPDLPAFSDAEKVFCDEFNMCEGSPEAEFAVAKESGATPILERTSSALLAQSKAVLATYDRRRESAYEVMVPIIVTSGRLYTCQYTPNADQLSDGRLGPGEGTFKEVEFVRFRKSLASDRSNHYDEESLSAEAWYADRERTVFVVQARSIAFFLTGFRVLTHISGDDYPPAFTDPPRVETDPWRLGKLPG